MVGYKPTNLRVAGQTVVFAETEGSMPHPLCAVIGAGLKKQVSQALDEGTTGVGRLWRRLGGSTVRLDESRAFSNLNCPEDVDAWLERYGRSQPLSGIAHGND